MFINHKSQDISELRIPGFTAEDSLNSSSVHLITRLPVVDIKGNQTVLLQNGGHMGGIGRLHIQTDGCVRRCMQRGFDFSSCYALCHFTTETPPL
jgi:hypothetical protein